MGMAVTRSGIPMRVWCWPGNTNDSALIRESRITCWPGSLHGRCGWADRGFSSAEHRRYLQRAGYNYIEGEKLRGDSAGAKGAPSRQAATTRWPGNLQVK